MAQGQSILVADDHPLTREGLALAARTALPGADVDHAGSISEAEAAIRRTGTYSLVLLDFVLPDVHGFSGFLRLQHMLGKTPIVIVSARQDAVLAEAANALGAAGFLSKTRPLDELAESFRKIAAGQRIFPPTTGPGEGDPRARFASLSGAQLRVLLALADGRLNKQIANDLDITEATVKAHLTAIFRKLGVRNRTQALLAMQPLLGDEAGSAQ